MYYKIKNRFFTLIELLVVIAIISILMTMLLPALRKARDKSQEAVCSSNLKQNGLSSIMYANDYNGWIDNYDERKYFWYETLAEGNYIPSSIGNYTTTINPSTRPITLCPSQSLVSPLIDGHANADWVGYGTIIDSLGNGTNARYMDTKYNLYLILGGDSYHFVRILNVPQPSDFIYMVDSAYSNDSGWAKSQASVIKTYDANYGVCLRHSQQANCFFADGHADTSNSTRLKECGVSYGVFPNGDEYNF